MKWLAVCCRRQLCAHQSTGDLNAHTGVRCTTHNLKILRLPHIHLAHPQAIGIGVLLHFFYFTHHHFGEWGCHGLQVFHLQPRHGQGVGELCSGELGIAKLAQPGFWELHGEGDLSVLKLIETETKSANRHQKRDADR